MKVSIITAVLNGELYLKNCLESVACQKGVEWEHLLQDGGSTDRTLEIAACYKHVKVESDTDSGMSQAINKGLARATGDWCLWLNADDCLKPGALKTFVDFAQKHALADVIYGGWDFVDVAGRLEKRMSVFPLRRLMLAHMGCYIGSTACFFRKSTIVDEGYFLNENFYYVMDGEFYNRLARAKKNFVYLPLVLAEFRRHNSNLSLKNSSKNGIDNLLKQEKQWAESSAIRREYGITLFRCEHANRILDSILYYVFLIQKWFLKRCRKPIIVCDEASRVNP